MNAKGFLGSIFDLSFSNFITTKIIKVVFILAIIGSVLTTLSLAMRGLGMMFDGWFLMGLFMLVIAPLVGLFYLILARIYCELLLVVFRIAGDLRELLTLQKDGSSSSSVSSDMDLDSSTELI